MSESQATILHVDDNETNRYVVTRILQNAGFTVVEAATGVEGLAEIGRHGPDLVVLDVNLPDFNGFEICRQIKSNPETAMIPVLHLSATFVQSQHKAEGLESGADGYLAQPVEPIELIATIRSLLRIRRAEEAFRVSAQEWKTTFDAIEDSVCLVDREGKILRCNRSTSELFGKPSYEILGRLAHELMNAKLGIGDGSCFYRARETRQRQVVELQGKGRWFAKTIDPVLDKSGTFTGAAFILSDITDRKQAELALIQSEERLKLTIDSARIGTFNWDILTQQIVWNDYHRIILGYPADMPASYAAWEQRVAVEDLQRVTTAVQIARDTQTDYACEYRIVWEDGSIHWLEAFGRFYYNDNGQALRMAGVINEITDRKQAELALQESEYKLNTGIQVAGVALAQFDYTSNLVTLSPIAAAMYGFATNELEVSRDRIHNTFHPDEYAELMEIIAQVLDPTGKGWFERDHRVVWSSGEVRWLSVRKQVFFDRSGAVHRPSHAILAAIDITDRKQTEEDLRQTQAIAQRQLMEIKAIYQTAPIGLAVLDTDLRYQRLNQRLAEINGISIEDHIGRTVREIVPALADANEPLLRQVLETGEPLLNMEISGETKAQPGVCRTWIENCYLLKDADGQGIGINVVVQEITDRKQAEAALEERNNELDSFVHIVSHDLKAPLRSISNLSQWIEEDLEGSLTSDSQQQLLLLRSRVYRMSAMIDGLLDYARAGRTDKTIERTAIADLLREVIDSLGPPPTFRISLAPDLPTFNTKRLLLSQVLANLIGNAIKHHDRVDGSIHISVKDRDNFYEFAVADDGPGINLEYQNSIFTIFQTGNPQNNKDSTGIGLAIVKKLVEAETGMIRLESQIGKGTTFYFTWPKSPIW
jgi:PAS domain S-box-containing protein